MQKIFAFPLNMGVCKDFFVCPGMLGIDNYCIFLSGWSTGVQLRSKRQWPSALRFGRSLTGVTGAWDRLDDSKWPYAVTRLSELLHEENGYIGKIRKNTCKSFLKMVYIT